MLAPDDVKSLKIDRNKCPQLNIQYRWAKITMHNMMHPYLGYGFVS